MGSTVLAIPVQQLEWFSIRVPGALEGVGLSASEPIRKNDSPMERNFTPRYER
jgi:hypothetical protein